MPVEHLVVGAGVVGTAVALGLARQGREVLVVEAATVAAGASGGPGKRGVRANGRDRRELALARRANELWPDLADAVGHPTGYERTGHLHLSERDDDRPELLAQVERQWAAGIASELVDGPRLRELEPGLSDEVVAAVHCPSDGVADHTATTVGLAAAARAAGAELREATPVTGLRRLGDGIEAELADSGTVVGGTTVVCANAGAADLLAPLGAVLPVFPVFPQVVLTEPMAPPPVRTVLGHAHRPLAVKALPDGSVMVTGGRLGRWDPGAGHGVVEPDQVAANLADAAATLPALADAAVASAVADRPEAVSHDLVPVVDLVPGVARALVATGWSGHGWAIAPSVAELVVDWVTTGTRPPGLAAFGLDRFPVPA